MHKSLLVSLALFGCGEAEPPRSPARREVDRMLEELADAAREACEPPAHFGFDDVLEDAAVSCYYQLSHDAGECERDVLARDLETEQAESLVECMARTSRERIACCTARALPCSSTELSACDRTLYEHGWWVSSCTSKTRSTVGDCVEWFP